MIPKLCMAKKIYYVTKNNMEKSQKTIGKLKSLESKNLNTLLQIVHAIILTAQIRKEFVQEIHRVI